MIILGLIFIVLALLAALFLFLGTQALDPIQLDVLNQSYAMSPIALVIAGAVAMTLLWWGWALVRVGTRRRVRKSKEAKEAARQAELDRAAREKENQAKWERELRDRERQVRESEARLVEQERVAPGSTSTGTPGTAATAAPGTAPGTRPPVASPPPPPE